MTNERRVLVHADKNALAAALAARFITKVVDLLDQQTLVHVALTGGSVGIAVLAAINNSPARDTINWARVAVWWSDERWLPAGDPERNDTQARAALLDQVGLLPENVHYCPAPSPTMTLEDAAARYAIELAEADHSGSDIPTIDIMFLGVGPDGHIASLFPNLPGIRVQSGTVITVRNSPKPPPERLSLTLGAINRSARIWIALAGADKATALGLALAGAGTVEVPVAGVQGRLRTVFFVDQEAAADIPHELIVTEY